MNKEEVIRVSSIARQLKAERSEARIEANKWRNIAAILSEKSYDSMPRFSWEKPSHEDSMETGEGNRPDLTENERPKWTT
jgi:hypothetical protein